MELKQHPLSAAFPAMSAEDYESLRDDIKAHGQREPVMVHEGMVLDGWHRYRACVELGIKPQQFTFSDGDPVSFVLSHNLHRRHLTASQRAAAVVACTAWQPANVKKARGEMVSPLTKTNAEMAKAAQVSDRTIKDAKAAHKAGLGDAVKQGAMTAHEAAQVARGKPAKQKREIDPKPAEVPEPTADERLNEAQDVIAALAEENETLRDKLAVESMDGNESAKTEAADTIRELRAQVKALEAELSAVKASRDSLMRESAERLKQISYWKRKAEKAEKATA